MNVAWVDRKNLEEAARRADHLRRARIAQAVRDCRKVSGYTQQDLAALVGVDHTTISLIERGETVPLLGTLETMANILGVSIDRLVGRSMPPLAEASASDSPPTRSEFDRLLTAVEQLQRAQGLVIEGAAQPESVQTKRSRKRPA